MKKEKPKDCQHEPPYPNHKTVVFSIRAPDYYVDKIEHFEDVRESNMDGFIPVEEIKMLGPKVVREIKEEVGY